jgi:hypothetical protein
VADIFDQVVYTETRARGYTLDWNPTVDTQNTLFAINQVLAEYRAYLPMTARQIFYRLIGQNVIAKSENSYQRLLSILTKARRAELIPFSSIRDDGTVSRTAGGWDDPDQWIRSMPGFARGYQRDLRQGQDTEVEVWVEAAGMVPQVASMASRYGVSVFSSGGFDSLTVKYDAAQRILRTSEYEGRETVVLHVGDLDPSGVALFNAAREDINAFLEREGTEPEWERVAVNLDQIDRYSLATAPPKPRKNLTTLPGGWEMDWPTVQAEAFPPDQLIDLIERQIQDRLDLDRIDRVIRRSATEASRLEAAIRAANISIEPVPDEEDEAD